MGNEMISWNADEVAEGLAAVDGSRIELLQDYADLIDSYHGVERSLDYHELIGGDWLQQFTHVVYAAWRTVSAGVERRGNPTVPLISDSRTFSHQVCLPEFHMQIERVAAALLSSASFPHVSMEGDEAVISLGAKRNWQRRLFNTVIGPRKPSVLFCHPYYKCTRGEWLTTLWQWRSWAKHDDLEYPIQTGARLDIKWRRARSAASGPVKGFVGLVRAMMPLYVPVALLEGFPALRRSFLALDISRPRLAYTANALQGHLGFKILMADWRQEGTQLVTHQHGGGYGIDLQHAVEDYESQVSDRFYSWGWARPDRPVFSLSPANMRPPAQRNTRVLFCSVEYPMTVFRLHYQPMPGTMETLIKETVGFLALLHPSSDLLIRPYHIDFGWKMAAALRRTAPWAKFDDERPSSFLRYAESRLVIHNYLGTSWLETLALNIPTICFYDPHAYRFRHAVTPYIDALERAGVLHRQAASAARFASSVWKDPSVWWNSAEVQAARESFVGSYANFSADWRRLWAEEFEGLR